MPTYSVNISQPTESTSYMDIDYIISKLPDNTDKEIDPRDIRDASISNWDVPSFKETKATASTISYIGIDSGDAAYRDVKSKIFFGKREFSSSELMSVSLLSPTMSDTDIFLFNTKKDSISQLKTRISILAGTDASLYSVAPYLQSQTVTGTAGQVLSFDIVNPSGGDISVTSDYGTVSLNGIIYPTIVDTGLSASSNRVLRYNDGQLYWDDIITNFYDTVGTSSSVLNIFGTPVLINGSPIEFTSSKETPVAFNGVSMGRSFDSAAIVEVLREILYPYLSPLCTLSINQSVAEFGTFPSISLDYSVTKRTLSVTTVLSNMIPGSISPIVSSSNVTVFGSASGVYISNTDTIFKITSSDGTQSASASQTLNFVYPYFSGLLSSSSIGFSGLSTLDKIVDSQNDQLVGLIGSGYIYFIYDNDYPVLNKILADDIEVYGASSSMSSFTHSVVTLTSPDWLWASHQFKVYRSMTSSYSFIPPAANYQFKY